MSMAADALSLLALVHRLAAVDARIRSRLERLLLVDGLAASAVLGMAGGGSVTDATLQRDFDLSPGVAVVLRERLLYAALVRYEPDPWYPHAPLLRLSEQAERELSAALAGLVERLDAIPAPDREAIASGLTTLADAALGDRSG
jgi:hypothetical protein